MVIKTDSSDTIET